MCGLQTRGARRQGGWMRHYLVVANQTLKKPELTEKIRTCIEAGPCDFFLLVPATRTHGPVRWTPADAFAVARRRLESALERFRALGADIVGDVGVVLPDKADSATTTPSAITDTSATSDIKTVSVNSGDGAGGTVDLTFQRPNAPASNPAGQASWVLGLALALLSEGAAERVIMAEVLAEAAGRSRALEGAYGRAVALLSEYPGDPLVRRTVDLLAKALLRSRRPARAPEEA